VSLNIWDAQLESIAKGSQSAGRIDINNINGIEQEAAWRVGDAGTIQPFETHST
jgi:error-prone DNA polymerase